MPLLNRRSRQLCANICFIRAIKQQHRNVFSYSGFRLMLDRLSFAFHFHSSWRFSNEIVNATKLQIFRTATCSDGVHRSLGLLLVMRMMLVLMMMLLLFVIVVVRSAVMRCGVRVAGTVRRLVARRSLLRWLVGLRLVACLGLCFLRLIVVLPAVGGGGVLLRTLRRRRRRLAASARRGSGVVIGRAIAGLLLWLRIAPRGVGFNRRRASFRDDGRRIHRRRRGAATALR